MQRRRHLLPPGLYIVSSPGSRFLPFTGLCCRGSVSRVFSRVQCAGLPQLPPPLHRKARCNRSQGPAMTPPAIGIYQCIPMATGAILPITDPNLGKKSHSWSNERRIMAKGFRQHKSKWRVDDTHRADAAGSRRRRTGGLCWSRGSTTVRSDRASGRVQCTNCAADRSQCPLPVRKRDEI